MADLEILGNLWVIYRVTATHVVVWSVWPGRRPLAEDVVADQPE
ncbi:MAG TPA: hypothetical protein PK826_11915 [Anaerolineae bacterium]|nr:hypothetical protein [Anaerolineae bacterium]HRA20539.1 hypothetical protein [Anaerolineae bacterium]